MKKFRYTASGPVADELDDCAISDLKAAESTRKIFFPE